MQLIIPDILSSDSVRALRDSLADDSLFEEGARTAAAKARQIKNNLQLNPANAKASEILRTIEQSLVGNPTFMAATLPKRFATIMVNRYDAGMTYGAHVDDPVINQTRTDVSFTLFLTDPDTYEGGALVLAKPGDEERIKLPAGSLVTYPSTALHYVEEVRAGTRLAAVGWLQSVIREPSKREILFTLQQATLALPEGDDRLVEAQKHLANAKSNLLRLWADY